MKNYSVYAASALFLITALLVTNCLQPIDTLDLPIENPPPGMRYLMINIDSSNARTIMPIDLQPIASYEVTLTPVSGKGTDKVTGKSDGKDPIILVLAEATIYNVEVYGYSGEAGNSDILAKGTHSDIDSDTISSSESITVKMQIIDNKGTGTFTWDFIRETVSGSVSKLPSNLDFMAGDTAVITFTALSEHIKNDDLESKTIIFSDVLDDLKSTPFTQRTLNSGYYLVSLIMKKDNHFSGVIENVVHIYKNQETKWAPKEDQFPPLSPKTLTVSYDLTNAIGSVASSTGLAHGATIPGAPAQLGVTPPVGQEFDGWWEKNGTDDNIWGEQWIFADNVPSGSSASRVFKNLILYARWKDE